MTKRVGRRPSSPTGNPRGGYRSPYPHPPTTYPYPPRNRSAEIITISLLVAAFMLLGLGGMLWLVQTRVAFGPTPTPTPTRGVPFTATPDYLSTRVAEDFLTQQAYQMAVLGTTTPTPIDRTPPAVAIVEETPEATPTPVIVRLPGVNAPGIPTPEAPEATAASSEEISPLETPTPNVVNLPVVMDNSPLATPTPAQVAEIPTDALPTTEPTASAMPTEFPTETPTPTLAVADTPTPTPTETIPPPTPTATLLPPGQPYMVPTLQAFVESEIATLRLAPSNIYTAVTQLARGTKVTVLNRNASGEWLLVCCIESQPSQAPAWVRQAYVRPRDNVLQNGAPEGANANDVRWLAPSTAALPTYLQPLPTPIPPGPNDFPLYRYDRHGQGRVNQLPNPPFGPAWANEARAAQAFGSPVTVLGSNVLVGSLDQHLYSFQRETGGQLWRFNICDGECRQMTQAAMTYDDDIFIVDQNRTVWSLSKDNPPVVHWRVTIDQAALTSFNVFSDTIYLATGEGANHTLLALDRDNGAEIWRHATSGPGLRYPVIGDQLIYAADGVVEAYDLFRDELVWRNNDVQNIIAGPVYGSPGPSSLAEIYVVASNNRIYALDANTGVELWNIDNGEGATSLALNDNLLFVAGDNYVKAISRQDRYQVWRTPVTGGAVMGGPLVDANRVLVVTQAGVVSLLDNQGGGQISVPSIASFAAGAPAISGPYIFVPGTDGRLYELLGSQ